MWTIPVTVTLTVGQRERSTLNGTTGLSFTVGDGTADGTMTFSGTDANIQHSPKRHELP